MNPEEILNYSKNIELDIISITKNIQKELDQIVLLKANLESKNIIPMNDLINKVIKTDPLCIRTINHYMNDHDNNLTYENNYNYRCPCRDGEYEDGKICYLVPYFREVEEGDPSSGYITCSCDYSECFDRIETQGDYEQNTELTKEEMISFLLQRYIISVYKPRFWKTLYIQNPLFKNSHRIYTINYSKPTQLIKPKTIEQKISELLKKRNRKIKNKIIERLYNPDNGIIFKKRMAKY